MGDGSAIIPKNWSEALELRIYNRIKDYAPERYTKVIKQRGIRPYMDNGLQQVSPKLWIATGGAKSGMALAGVYANKLAEALS